MAKRKQSKQEKALRGYFAGKKRGRGLIVLVIGAFLAFIAWTDDSFQFGIEDAAPLLFVAGVGLGLLGLLMLMVSASRGAPSDSKIDAWFDESMERLKKESLSKLNLSEDQLTSNPLLVRGPILWSTNGVPDEDLRWRTGKDDVTRFAIYRVSIIQLTEQLMAAYSCDYNFLRAVALNEETDEYHYQDVVGVSTREDTTSYTLPSGTKLAHAQWFRVSVTSGESIEVLVEADKLYKMTKSERLPETGAEQAVATIRTMLRSKKGVVSVDNP
ncbi:MAG: hypothetical protein GY759_03290 [Chloroflexi bacterium]|nr:hypothetical protein [Chloroflexota bacterium]